MSQAGVTTTSNRGAEGSIYDLGYRHYEGVRRGRAWAMWSLYTESLRGIWGFGRPMTAKAAPFILAGLFSIVALVQLAFASVFAQAIARGESISLATYANYFEAMWVFVFLFCVAQAPEVVCRDQRYSVLALYFTRALGRLDYAGARLASLVTAIFIVLMIPNLLLLIGDVLMKPDTFKALGDELPKALPSIPADIVIAASMASISLAIASFTPRRAYAAIGIVAYVLLMEAIPAAIYSIGQSGSGETWTDKLFLLAPMNTLEAATHWFFGVPLDPSIYAGSLTPDQYLAAAIASVVVFTGILMYRYRRVSA
jgi:ABC-2 type transport system permease protein